jgi:hypothetical protein
VGVRGGRARCEGVALDRDGRARGGYGNRRDATEGEVPEV